MQAPYFLDWRGVYRSEHLPGNFVNLPEYGFWLHPWKWGPGSQQVLEKRILFRKLR